MWKEGWGEGKKESMRGTMGRGIVEARMAPSFSFFPLSHVRLLISIVALFLIGIPNGSLCGGERESLSQDPPAKFISLPQASIVSSNKEREYRNQSTDAERGNRKRL